MKKILIYCSHSLKDPLVEGLMLQYLKGTAHSLSNKVQFLLITEEQDRHKLSSELELKEKESLAAIGVKWIPRKYQGGKFLIIKKAFSTLSLIISLFLSHLKKPFSGSIGFLSLAGGYVWAISKILRIPFGVFCFEPHSLYMKDFGYWDEKGSKFRLLNFFERKEVQKSLIMTVPTDGTVALVKEIGTNAELIKLPIGIDTSKFIFRSKERSEIRLTRNFSNKRVFLYLGKFDGIYYSMDIVASFFSAFIKEFPEALFWVITPDDITQLSDLLKQKGLSKENFYLENSIPYSEIDKYLSAADAGVLAVPPLDSQKYRTPVKTANYLACGLPYLVTKGLADDDKVAIEKRVGVVVESFDDDNAVTSAKLFKEFFKEDTQSIQQRCREVAVTTRDTSLSVDALTKMCLKFI